LSKNNEHERKEEREIEEKEEEQKTLPAEKARKQYMAEQELAAFARLFFARIPEDRICQELKIHRATYYRYLERLGKQQEELLTDHILPSTYAEIASFRNTLRFVEIHMKQILVDKESDNTDKIAAADLLCNVAWASVKLHTDGPIQTAKQMPADLKKRIINNNNAKQQPPPPPELIAIKTAEEIVVEQDNNSSGNNNSGKGESKERREDGTGQGSAG